MQKRRYRFVVSDTDIRYSLNAIPNNCVESVLGTVCRMRPDRVIPLHGDDSDQKESVSEKKSNRGTAVTRPNGWIAVTRRPGEPVEISVGRLRYFKQFTEYYPVEMLVPDEHVHKSKLVVSPEGNITLSQADMFRVVLSPRTTRVCRVMARHPVSRHAAALAAGGQADPLSDYVLENVGVDSDLSFGADSGFATAVPATRNGALVCVYNTVTGSQCLFVTKRPTSPDSVRRALGAGPECSVGITSASVNTRSNRMSGWRNRELERPVLDELLVRPLVDIVMDYAHSLQETDSSCFDDLVKYAGRVPGLRVDPDTRKRWMMEIFDTAWHLGECAGVWKDAIQNGPGSVWDQNFVVDKVPGFYSRRDALLLRALARGFLLTSEESPTLGSLGISGEGRARMKPLFGYLQDGHITWSPTA